MLKQLVIPGDCSRIEVSSVPNFSRPSAHLFLGIDALVNDSIINISEFLKHLT